MLEDLLGRFKGWLETPQGRRRSALVPRERTLFTEGPPTLDPTSMNGGYLILTLSEVYLASRGWRLRDYLPLCLVVLKTGTEANRSDRLFMVSHRTLQDKLRGVLGRDEEVAIEFSDTPLAGPLPLSHEHLEVFVALFRVKRGDRIELLMDLFADLGAANPITAYLPLAKTVYDGVNKLLGLSDVDYLFGAQQGFELGSGLGQPLKTGFMAVTGAGEADLPESEIWVKDRRLYVGLDREHLTPCREHDLALLALECRESRGRFTDLPFNALWTELKGKLVKGPPDSWRVQWEELLAAVLTSPDLTESDQTLAMASYKEARDGILAFLGGAAATGATRGGRRVTAMGILNRAGQKGFGETVDAVRTAKPEADRSTDVSNAQIETIAAELGSKFTKAHQKLPPPRAFLRALAEHDPL